MNIYLNLTMNASGNNLCIVTVYTDFILNFVLCTLFINFNPTLNSQAKTWPYEIYTPLG